MEGQEKRKGRDLKGEWKGRDTESGRASGRAGRGVTGAGTGTGTGIRRGTAKKTIDRLA